MPKTILLLFFSFISFAPFAMSKRKQISKVTSCQLLMYKNEFFAGSEISVIFSLELSTGEIVYSNGGSKIGFEDFRITIKGAGILENKSKSTLDIRSYYNGIEDPFIHLNAQLIKRPEIEYNISIPIHFKGNYEFELSAFNGLKVGKTSYGRTGEAGYATFDNRNHINGKRGEDGGNGRNGTSGESASPVNVYLSLVKFEFRNKQLVKIEIKQNTGENYIRYVDKQGSVTIRANGGNGSDGVDGGEGGAGGRGSNDFGGNGGRGGNGGDGGHGGNGGNGGDVRVYFGKGTWFFKDHIFIESNGGKGGVGGKSGIGGRGGMAGKGGTGYARSGVYGNSGKKGADGYDGKKGMINYYRDESN